MPRGVVVAPSGHQGTSQGSAEQAQATLGVALRQQAHTQFAARRAEHGAQRGAQVRGDGIVEMVLFGVFAIHIGRQRLPVVRAFQRERFGNGVGQWFTQPEHPLEPQ